MTKSYYTWLLFFLGVYAFSLLLENIIRLLLGPELFLLDLFGVWFLILTATATVASV